MARNATQETSAVEQGLLQLDPALILADDNTRFNLKESRIQSLAESIIAQGGVMEPIEVEPLAETNPPSSENGFKYRLTTGFYRLAAVNYLNTAEAAGLKIPAIVHRIASPVERLKRQLAENIERENQSPMDQAVAIRRLLELDIPKMEVRQIFARPGGRKGGKIQPASNSFINMTLSFLDLPKSFQEKIHDGHIGVAAAYQLTKVDPDKRAAVLEWAEEEGQRALEVEEREEEKLPVQGKKQAEAAEKRDTMKMALEVAEVKNTEAKAKFHQLTDAVVEAFKKSKMKHDTPKAKKEAETAFKAAEQARKVAEADAADAQKESDKLQQQFTRRETLETEKSAKLKEARAKAAAGNAKQKKAVGPADVQKAAAAIGASTANIMLNASEMRKVVNELCLAEGDETVIAIGKAFQNCFAGITNPKRLYNDLVRLVR